MQSVDELKNKCQFLYNYDPKHGSNYKSAINETHGYVDNLQGYIAKINEYVHNYIRKSYDILEFFGLEFVIPAEVFNGIAGPFDGLAVKVTVKHDKDNIGWGASYYPFGSKLKPNQNTPMVSLDLIGTIDTDFTDQIADCISHELTHAHEGAKRVMDNPDTELETDKPFNTLEKVLGRKYNQHDLHVSMDRQNYGNCVNLMNKFPDQFMYQFIYHTTNFEENAFISSMYYTVKQNISTLHDVPSIIKAFHQTSQYNYLYQCELYLTRLQRMNKNGSIKQIADAIAAYNTVNPNYTVRNFNQLYKILSNRYTKFKNKMDECIRKMAGDIYMEINNDGVNPSKYQVPQVKTNKLGHKQWQEKRPTK